MKKELTKNTIILVVDDEPDFLDMIKCTIETQFDNVRYASSGAEAVKLFKLQKFDAVVCDYKMPTMDGLLLVEELYKINMFIPIIIQSGAYDDPELLKALENGKIFDIIPKPSPAEVINSRIYNALVLSQYVDLAWSIFSQNADMKTIEEFKKVSDSAKKEYLAAYIALQKLKSLNKRVS